MPPHLNDILAATKLRLARTRVVSDLPKLESRAQEHSPRGFRSALEAKSKDGIAVIAELKKASPSRGIIRADFDPDALAAELEGCGATALSVLTDEEFFKGSLENLRRASAATKLPCLRKDFILEEFQLFEARANCADAVLLIVAALPQKELERLAHKAVELQLDVLCEVHDESELRRALDAGCTMIGINNRDLKTFKVDLENAFRLSRLIPKNVFSVSESGINTGADIARLRSAGFGAFLVGESLMKDKNPGEALRILIAEAKMPPKPTANDSRPTTVP